MVVLLAALPFEVDGDRPPVADQVVEQETRRPVVAGATVEIRRDDALEGTAVVVGTGRGDGLQDEQHAAREVLVRVLVEPDLLGEVGDVHGRAERPLASGIRAMAAEDLAEVLKVRCDGRPGVLRVERELRHRDRLAGPDRRAAALCVDEQPIEVAHARHLRATPGAEEDDARLVRQPDLGEVARKRVQSRLAALPGLQQRGKAHVAPRREVVERAERRGHLAGLHGRERCRMRRYWVG